MRMACITHPPTTRSAAHTRACADIAAVLACLADDHAVPPKHVILYGQSVGSGPSCALGAERDDVAGVVLHSPLLSGFRVLKPHIKFWCVRARACYPPPPPPSLASGGMRARAEPVCNATASCTACSSTQRAPAQSPVYAPPPTHTHT